MVGTDAAFADDETACRQALAEDRIEELEKKLCDYETAVAENEAVHGKTATGLTLLDSAQDKQTCIFNELARRHNALCLKHAFVQEQLGVFHDENACFRFDENQLYAKLDNVESAVADAADICAALRDDNRTREKEYARLVGVIRGLRVKQRQIELELTEARQRIACVDKSIAENRDQIAELEKKNKVEQVKNDCLQCSMAEIKLDHETVTSSLKSELATIQDQYNEKSIELAKSEQRFVCTQRECEVKNDELQKLKKQITNHQLEYKKENCRFAEEIDCLNGRIKSSRTKLDLNSKQLPKVQAENNLLKCQLQDQLKTTKELTMAGEYLRLEIKQIAQDHELAVQKLAAECKQQENETKLHDRKSMLRVQDKIELGQLSEDLSRQIKRLQAHIADAVKPTAAGPREKFKGVMEKYDEFLYDDDDDQIDDNNCGV